MVSRLDAPRPERPSLRSGALVVSTFSGLLGGAAAHLEGHARLGDTLWAAGAVIALALVGARILVDVLKRRAGVDVIALLAIGGALLLGEYLASALIGAMMATGGALEGYATARARRELSALLARAPRTAHRREGADVTTVPIGAVAPGDRLLVAPGEIVPVDGVVVGTRALLDESALTGEPRPVEKAPGDRVGSGTTNAGAAFELRAVASADESTYAGIVGLVQQASASKAPLARIADRHALAFAALSLAMAAVAWGLSRDAGRGLAVLVVATPCPLLLAVPIAIVGGISRSARRGIVVKGGAALEALARAEILLLDKTGTLTFGGPRVTGVTCFRSIEDDAEVLRLAASLEQASSHPLSAALVRAARERRLGLSFPEGVHEAPGAGMTGWVDGRAVRVGSAEWAAQGTPLPEEARAFRRRASRAGAMTVFVAVDGGVIGALTLDDPIRPDAPRTLRALRRVGIRRVVMVTGDHPLVAEAVGATLGVDRVLAQRSPEEKVAAVREARAEGLTVMIGDGINDAPALAAADVGVAMGARGATSSAEAADVVLVVDRLDRFAEAVSIARRARTIAVQSALLGMGLSLFAMGAAAFGFLPPAAGALLQEAIDVAAILSALRAQSGGRGARRPALGEAMSRRLEIEHDQLIPRLDRVRVVAERIDRLAREEAREELEALDRFLRERLLPHERADDAEVYPVISRLLGGEDPLASMSATHREIFHLVRLYEQLLGELDPRGPTAADVQDFRRILYGLHAVLRLHFAQEEELYASLSERYHADAPDQPAVSSREPPLQPAPAPARRVLRALEPLRQGRSPSPGRQG
ncbi:ATPase P [Sorangium cellulosum]|uniref:P-type Zn(2+) transporter n=1 Tax=Sorangium cellulosum TaxID=56 RepID=A0A4P2R4H9_SORCE|nr:ATPase P [Sorangium cellulosum]WCQ96820.1 ATPase [Sorangium sp. Soce836]